MKRQDGWAQEGARRILAAQEAMGRHGLDGLLLANSTNLLFLSGYQTPELTLARPRFLVVPRTGDPVLVQHMTNPYGRTWVRDVRTYPQLSHTPTELLVRVVRELGINQGRLGAELGRDQRIGIPFADFIELRGALEPTAVEDAAGLLWEIRRVKSPRDLACIREACRITGEAFARTFERVGAGDHEADAVRIMKMEITGGGGQDPWVLSASGSTDYGARPDRDDPLDLGDLVWLDAGCRVQGFWCDFSRAAVVGPPSRDQVDAQRLCRSMTDAATRMARPGQAISEIAGFCYERLEKLSVAGAVILSLSAGRVGHGIGFDVTEPPDVALHDHMLLEPGMTIAIEPSFATSFGKFHVEANVAIRGGEPELLSTAPWELWELKS